MGFIGILGIIGFIGFGVFRGSEAGIVRNRQIKTNNENYVILYVIQIQT